MLRTARLLLLLLISALLLVGPSARADFKAKVKMSMTGMPMVGNVDVEQTYLVKGDCLAQHLTMSNPMLAQMGQPGQIATRSIVCQSAKRLVSVNYADSSYSQIEYGQLDSLAQVFEALGGMLDSLKKMVSVKKFNTLMSGKTKKIQNLTAEELTVDIDAQVMLPMGEAPVPMRITASGSYWGTKDFAEFTAYKAAVDVVQKAFMGGNQGGLGSLLPIFEKMGIDPKAMDEVKKFSSLLPLEGQLTIGLTMPGMGMDSSGTGTNFNMLMATTLVEVSKAPLSAAEFEVPKGFKQASGFKPGSGGFGFPGMGQ